ncbi:hypothetical protein [Streptomyces sp. NPDC001450]
MTDLDALADSLRSQLEPAERARLAQKLVSTREPEARVGYLVPDDVDWSAHESSSLYGDGDRDA